MLPRPAQRVYRRLTTIDRAVSGDQRLQQLRLGLTNERRDLYRLGRSGARTVINCMTNQTTQSAATRTKNPSNELPLPRGGQLAPNARQRYQSRATPWRPSASGTFRRPITTVSPTDHHLYRETTAVVNQPTRTRTNRGRPMIACGQSTAGLTRADLPFYALLPDASPTE